jgi:hypothetical protein
MVELIRLNLKIQVKYIRQRKLMSNELGLIYIQNQIPRFLSLPSRILGTSVPR